ncbi:MAG: nitrilase [Candidatus Solibacter usitatus]|nr:nitrilase [Candidatus Solibacter usitatus]
MDSREVIRAAVVQAGSVLFDTPATLEKLERFTAEAAVVGARVIVFPEAFIGGYPKGMSFGAVVGHRSPEGRKEFRRYFESAIDVPGSETERIGECARAHSVWLVTGVIERDGGTLYCTVLFFAPDGTLAGKHRKVMPTAMERLIWGYGDGSTLTVLDTGFARIGAVICWENYMPAMRMAMYAKGIELYCAPTVDDRETWAVSMRHIAFEGRCFVLSAVQHTDKIRGGSVIVNPQGQLLAGPAYAEEKVLTADLNLNEIAEGKWDLDTTGHYSRPDLFRITVNEQPQPPVSSTTTL